MFRHRKSLSAARRDQHSVVGPIAVAVAVLFFLRGPRRGFRGSRFHTEGLHRWISREAAAERV